jgi:Zn-finger nucleic acid-binding protein
MFTCPHCRTSLSKRKIPSLGLIWVCPSCRGRAMTLGLLRRTIPKSLVDGLWQQARADDHRPGRHCPACERQMAEVPIIPDESKMVCLDVCTICHVV